MSKPVTVKSLDHTRLIIQRLRESETVYYAGKSSHGNLINWSDTLADAIVYTEIHEAHKIMASILSKHNHGSVKIGVVSKKDVMVARMKG